MPRIRRKQYWYNSKVLLLVQMCRELNLFLGSTMFQNKNKTKIKTQSKCKTTGMHPARRQWHMNDYVLLRHRDV